MQRLIYEKLFLVLLAVHFLFLFLDRTVVFYTPALSGSSTLIYLGLTVGTASIALLTYSSVTFHHCLLPLIISLSVLTFVSPMAKPVFIDLATLLLLGWYINRNLFSGSMSWLFAHSLGILFFLNGIVKIGTEVWRDGIALGIILQSPLGALPLDFWTQTGSLKVFLNYCAIAIQVATYPLFLVTKSIWLLIACVVSFHLGSLFLLNMKYDSIALIFLAIYLSFIEEKLCRS